MEIGLMQVVLSSKLFQILQELKEELGWIYNMLNNFKDCW